MDRDGVPLALLGTAVDEFELDEMTGCEWSAGGRGELPFVASSLTDMAIRGATDAAQASSVGIAHTGRGAGGLHRDAEMLERQIRGAAGRGLNAQWFRREQCGAKGLAHRAPEGLAGWHLPEMAFPSLLIREDWADAREQALVSGQGYDQPCQGRVPASPRQRLMHTAIRATQEIKRIQYLEEVSHKGTKVKKIPMISNH